MDCVIYLLNKWGLDSTYCFVLRTRYESLNLLHLSITKRNVYHLFLSKTSFYHPASKVTKMLDIQVSLTDCFPIVLLELL